MYRRDEARGSHRFESVRVPPPPLPCDPTRRAFSLRLMKYRVKWGKLDTLVYTRRRELSEIRAVLGGRPEFSRGRHGAKRRYHGRRGGGRNCRAAFFPREKRTLLCNVERSLATRTKRVITVSTHVGMASGLPAPIVAVNRNIG